MRQADTGMRQTGGGFLHRERFTGFSPARTELHAQLNMPKMKVAIVFVLSLAVWILYKWMEPEAPLGKTETLVVVVVIGAVVFAVDWAIKRFRPKKERSV